MPVFTCSGPECPRLISVSSIPGGNPEALADPEGFAVHYLRCQACKKYFCDRSLVKLGLSMQTTKCPSCQGSLVNPNAASSNATAQPATLQVFQTTKVKVTGSSLLFPNLCACCGGPSNATVNVTSSYRRGNTRITNTWPVSSCQACSPHINSGGFNGKAPVVDVDQIKVEKKHLVSGIIRGILLAGLAWFMVAEGPLRREVPYQSRDTYAVVAGLLAFVLAFLFYRAVGNAKLNSRQREALAANERAKKTDENNAKKRASIGPNCCHKEGGAYCVGYTHSMDNYGASNGDHLFTFYRKDFAEAFIRLNRANVAEVTRSS